MIQPTPPYCRKYSRNFNYSISFLFTIFTLSEPNPFFEQIFRNELSEYNKALKISMDTSLDEYDNSLLAFNSIFGSATGLISVDDMTTYEFIDSCICCSCK